MKKLLGLFIIANVFFASASSVAFASDDVIYDAQVTEVSEVKEVDGLRLQTVSVEIIEGQNKGNNAELKIPLDEMYTRPLKQGDKIRVSLSKIGEDYYYQFYDFKRINNYQWLILLFIIILIAFLGVKGIRTLIPSLVILLFLFLGVIPLIFTLKSSLVLSVSIVAIVSAISAWIKFKSKMYSLILTFSIVVSVLAGLLIFIGFSQVSYVLPFIGSIATLDKEIYTSLTDVITISIMFVPLGAIISLGLQIIERLDQELTKSRRIEMSKMLKLGLSISQERAGIVINTFILFSLGLCIPGIYLIKAQYPMENFLDNGWIAFNFILVISTSLPLLILSPIIVLITAAYFEIIKDRVRGSRGAQRSFRTLNP